MDVVEFNQRPINIDSYAKAMDSSVPDKTTRVLRVLHDHFPQAKDLLSLGAGTISTEKQLLSLLPGSPTICALDLDDRLLKKLGDLPENLLLLQANALQLPFADNSQDVVVASALNHEILSYKDGYAMRTNFNMYLHEIFRVLRPGGISIFRDFAAPDRPLDQVVMMVGNATENSESALAFCHNFFHDFTGHEEEALLVCRQIDELQNKNVWMPGVTLKMSRILAAETMLHSSWAMKNPENYKNEIAERYCYLPLQEYANELLASSGNLELLEAFSYTQPGYPDHIDGKLNVLDGEKPISFPFPTTMVIAIRKLS